MRGWRNFNRWPLERDGTGVASCSTSRRKWREYHKLTTLFFLGTDLSFPYQLSTHFDFKGKNYAVVPFPKSRSPSLISWVDSWFGNSIWLNPISFQLTTWLASLLTLLKSTASMDSFAAETKLTASDTITADTLKRPRFVPSLNSFVGCG